MYFWVFLIKQPVVWSALSRTICSKWHTSKVLVQLHWRRLQKTNCDISIGKCLCLRPDSQSINQWKCVVVVVCIKQAAIGNHRQINALKLASYQNCLNGTQSWTWVSQLITLSVVYHAVTLLVKTLVTRFDRFLEPWTCLRGKMLWCHLFVTDLSKCMCPSCVPLPRCDIPLCILCSHLPLPQAWDPHCVVGVCQEAVLVFVFSLCVHLAEGHLILWDFPFVVVVDF